MTIQDELDDVARVRRVLIAGVVGALALGAYFVHKKVQNDTAIAVATVRVAEALEKIARRTP